VTGRVVRFLTWRHFIEYFHILINLCFLFLFIFLSEYLLNLFLFGIKWTLFSTRFVSILVWLILLTHLKDLLFWGFGWYFLFVKLDSLGNLFLLLRDLVSRFCNDLWIASLFNHEICLPHRFWFWSVWWRYFTILRIVVGSQILLLLLKLLKLLLLLTDYLVLLFGFRFLDLGLLSWLLVWEILRLLRFYYFI